MIFLILVIIQFVVITKGAERISEVAARFTLDAMPGKQMAIDADLNAGMITEAQANERRGKIVKESEFYGAMDGASKFIRGDAMAGLIITGDQPHRRHRHGLFPRHERHGRHPDLLDPVHRRRPGQPDPLRDHLHQLGLPGHQDLLAATASARTSPSSSSGPVSR